MQNAEFVKALKIELYNILGKFIKITMNKQPHIHCQKLIFIINKSSVYNP